MMTKRCGVLLGLMMSVGLFATPAHAQVNINVHIGEPPPVLCKNLNRLNILGKCGAWCA